MLEVLANRTYRHLFAAQLIALAGTGLLTVALGLPSTGLRDLSRDRACSHTATPRERAPRQEQILRKCIAEVGRIVKNKVRT